MFLGHYGLAFGAKKVAPRVSLLTLFVAVEFVDILWPFLLLLDVEKVKIHPGFTEVTHFEFLHYPYTHSLMMGIVWGLVCGGVYWLFQKDVRSAVVVGLAVLSHWFLDVVVHVPDLPLTIFGDQKVGMGLWNSLPATILVESAIFIAGVWIYVKNTRAIPAKGKWGLVALVAFFVVAELFNMFGPPPEDSIPALLASFVVLQAILLSLAHITDRNRAPVGER
ncbi:hypothetical protein [Dyadobacter fermentans]|uniref:Membrane-bound metal-dependent hydrolase n=1 Tax=Dyadobacter fermentans (strain ATCC 700827 / DSM 18053 / CIP 107007 / KCTC 52180 / NS114) TaxID=471854 RepID=C6W507_DYAFD|nr:hypothetical protein [Dyadobacter fermentans]ACT92367.1 conserved hypothetical protein [Dyadobacter fermentans DSM 18053]